MMGATLAGLLWACTAKEPQDSTQALPRRALVVGVDGTRADAFEAANTPNLDAAFADGALTMEASTQLTGITVSGPGWTSLLTGFEVEDHGVVDNDTLLQRTLPTFPELVQDAGQPTAVIAHWEGIVLIVGAENVDAMLPIADDVEVGAGLLSLVEDGDHALIFAHFDDVDHAGHDSGFSPENPNYIAAIEGVDSYVGPALEAVRADTAHEWMVVLVSDHGGSGTSHGTPDAENRTIPMGVSVVPTVPTNPNHMDVAVTVMDWFGLGLDGADGQSWLGG